MSNKLRAVSLGLKILVFQQIMFYWCERGKFSGSLLPFIYGLLQPCHCPGVSFFTGLKVFFHLNYFLKVIVLFKVSDLMMLKSKIKLREKHT